MKFSKKRRVVANRARTSKKVQTGKGFLKNLFRGKEKDESLARYVVENNVNQVKQMLEEGRMDNTTIVGSAAVPAMLNRTNVPIPLLVIAVKNWIGNENPNESAKALLIVQQLLKNGASINIKDNAGKTLLFINSFDTYAKLNLTKWTNTILPFLLKNGGDPNVLDNKEESFVNNVAINVLLKNKFDINMKYANGWNVAMGAADSFLRDQVDTFHFSKIMNFTDDEMFRTLRALLIEKHESVKSMDGVLAEKIKQILDKYPPREADRAESLPYSSPKKTSPLAIKSVGPNKLKNAASKINVRGKQVTNVERGLMKRPSPTAEPSMHEPTVLSERQPQENKVLPMVKVPVSRRPIVPNTPSKPKNTTPVNPLVSEKPISGLFVSQNVPFELQRVNDTQHVAEILHKPQLESVSPNPEIPPEPRADLDRPLRHVFSKRKLPVFNRRRTPTPGAPDKKNTQKINLPKLLDMADQVSDLNQLKKLGKREHDKTQKTRNENKLSAYYDIYSNPHDLSPTPTPSPVAQIAPQQKKGFFHGIKQMFNKTFKRKVKTPVFGVATESDMKKTAKRPADNPPVLFENQPINPLKFKGNKKHTKKQSPIGHKRRHNYEQIEYVHLNGNRREEKQKQHTRKRRGYEKIEYINM